MYSRFYCNNSVFTYCISLVSMNTSYLPKEVVYLSNLKFFNYIGLFTTKAFDSRSSYLQLNLHSINIIVLFLLLSWNFWKCYAFVTHIIQTNELSAQRTTPKLEDQRLPFLLEQLPAFPVLLDLLKCRATETLYRNKMLVTPWKEYLRNVYMYIHNFLEKGMIQNLVEICLLVSEMKHKDRHSHICMSLFRPVLASNA